MRTLAAVALLCYVGRLDGGRCTDDWAKSGGVHPPHLHVMDVWREQPLDVILRGGPHLDGGAAACRAWRFLVREWTRLRWSSRLLRAVSVALLSFVLAVR